MPATRIPFNGPSYKLRNVNQSAQRCVNWYLEQTEHGGKTESTLIPTPGLRLAVTVGAGPVRGMLPFNDVLYVVSGADVYRVSTSYAATHIGTLDTSSGLVGMACNGQQILIVDGLYGYAVSIGVDAVTRLQENAITSLTWSSDSGGKVTATTTRPHGLAVGDAFTLSGFTPADYNGQWSAAAGTTGSTLVFLLPATVSPGSATVLGSLTGDGFPDGVTWAKTNDGYFIVGGDGTQHFHISAVNDVTSWNALDYASAEGDPDPLIAGETIQRELVFFGSNSVEFWYDSGNGTFPYQRSGNAFIETGCAALGSVAKLDNAVFFLGKDARGDGVVYRLDGYHATQISDHGVEQALSGYSSLADARAFTFQMDGHAFYALSFPSDDATWLYDVATGCWTEWLWWDSAAGAYHRHRAECHVMFGRDHIVGDWQNGNLYALDADTYTDISGAPSAIVCAYPMSASLAELQGVFPAVTGLLSASESDQKGSYTVASGLPAAAVCAISGPVAGPAYIDLSSGKLAIESSIVSPDISGGAGPYISTGFIIGRSDLSAFIQIMVTAKQDGTQNLAINTEYDLLHSSVISSASAYNFLIEFDAAAGTFSLKMNDVSVSLSANTYTPASDYISYGEVAERSGVDAGNAGKVFSVAVHTDLGKIVSTIDSGYSDVCGNEAGQQTVSYYPCAIRRLRVTQGADSENQRVFYQSIEIDAQAGVGLTTGQGSDPKLMLRWSDDGGHTWSNVKYLSIGKIGSFATRAKKEQLGAGRNRLWEISFTDPVPLYVMGAMARFQGSDA